MALMGIDLGTSSVKVLILDTQGQTLSTGTAAYPVLTPQPGWAESDPQAWWSATVSAVHAALAALPQTRITALGICGQMHGVVLTDEQGQPRRPAILWADTRAQAQLARYRALSPALQACLANPVVPGMAGPLLCWLAEHESAVFEQAYWALQPKDWLRFRLTDTVATDPSEASATLLFDLQADRWAGDVLAALALRRPLLPPILASATSAGRLSVRAAGALGLPAGLLVATGAADTAAAALGAGLLDTGSIQLTLGTGAQLIHLVREPRADPTGRTHRYRAADGVHWYAMAAVHNAGLALNWVRQLLGGTWEELYASATSVAPGADGLLFLPYLSEERPHHPIPGSRGAFLGMRLDHGRMHVMQAALEGVAYGLRVAMEALPAARVPGPLRLAGGGSMHPAWRQLLANILNRELHAIEMPAASARGAALLAGIASGQWANVQETAALAPQPSLVVTPEPAHVAAYQRISATYDEWVRR